MTQKKTQSGFTFLEVMIAVAVIAIALVTLIGSQSQSVSIASVSRVNVTASLLAQMKLAEVESALFEELYSEEGDFGEDFSSFSWRTEVNTLSADETGIAGADNMLKAVDLTIYSGDNDPPVYSVRAIVMKRIVPENL
ncbi:MAG: prepilin-type N-terminal cleavage/methylation domain-containing protein [Desulfobulbaceae bacterium]|nr:prepilin-type N-terminal cleavage/methylation domain-containing protein [Desulfobulbaceae bacterium]